MWVIFEVFYFILLNLLQYCFCCLTVWWQGVWNHSSPTRDRTHTSCIRGWSLNRQGSPPNQTHYKIKIINIKKATEMVPVFFHQNWKGSNCSKEERCKDWGWAILNTKQISLGLLLCEPQSLYPTWKRARTGAQLGVLVAGSWSLLHRLQALPLSFQGTEDTFPTTFPALRKLRFGDKHTSL